jgi:hypothetical protein
VGRRFGAFLAAAIAIAGCAPGETQNPYAVVDRAIVAGWDRVEVHVGFSIDIPAQANDGFPVGATSINVDPRSLGFALDGESGRWRLTVALPLDTLGVDEQILGMMAPGIDSIDLDLLFDGASVFVRSPLLPLVLEGAMAGLGEAPEGDMTGWVRLGGSEALLALGGVVPMPLTLPNGGQMPTLSLPSPGDLAALEQFLGDLGVAATYVGAEDADGLNTHHLKATLNLARLAESRELARITGFGREQLQGIFDASKEVTVAADVWIDRDTGRLATIRIDAATLDAPSTRVSLIVQLTEPGAGMTFEAPATFAELDLAALIQGSIEGGGGGGGVAVPEPTTAPAVEPTPATP